MFDQKQIEQYRNIKAPSELKFKIAADCNREAVRGNRIIGGAFPMQRLVRSLSAVAACLVLAVAVFSLARMNTELVTVSYGGTAVSEEKTVIDRSQALSARAVEPVGIPLSFDVKGEATVTVSDGGLYTVNEGGEEINSLGSATVITEDTFIWWAVADGFGRYEMTVEINGEQTVFILELNEDTPDGVIYKK